MNYGKWLRCVAFTLSEEGRRVDDPIIADWYRNYWRETMCDVFNFGVDLMIFDMARTVSAAQSIRCLQEAVGVEPNGIVEIATIAATNEFLFLGTSATELIPALARAQLACFAPNPTWSARVARRQTRALELALDRSTMSRP